MSEENVETVRESLEHFAATDEFLNVIAPDFVYGLLHTIRDGKIRRIEAYATHNEALQAAGLAR